MRKIALTVGSIACLGMGIGASQAEVCYNLVPFTDILRLNESMSLDQNGANHTQVWGQWISGSVAIPVSGAFEFSAGRFTVRQFGLTGALNPTINGNQICSLLGIFKAAWTLQCSGGSSGNFQNSGTSFTPVACPAAGPYDPLGSPSALVR